MQLNDTANTAYAMVQLSPNQTRLMNISHCLLRTINDHTVTMVAWDHSSANDKQTPAILESLKRSMSSTTVAGERFELLEKLTSAAAPLIRDAAGTIVADAVLSERYPNARSKLPEIDLFLTERHRLGRYPGFENWDKGSVVTCWVTRTAEGDTEFRAQVNALHLLHGLKTKTDLSWIQGVSRIAAGAESLPGDRSDYWRGVEEGAKAVFGEEAATGSDGTSYMDEQNGRVCARIDIHPYV